MEAIDTNNVNGSCFHGMQKEVEYICRGSLGELYQGPVLTNEAMDIGIISAISDNYTIAKFVPGGKCNLVELGKTKVKKALEVYFEKFGEKEISGTWTFESDCIVGAGMSSSTSDIVSALNCISNLLNRTLTIKNICDITHGIERSDSVFIQCPSLYLSQKQAIVDIYFPPKKIYCLYGIGDDFVNTNDTRELLLEYYEANIERYKDLLDRVQLAFKNKNLDEIITCSTISARLSQGVLPKSNFDVLMNNYLEVGAKGLVVAHTGSLIGLLYNDEISFEQLNKARTLFRSMGLDMKKGSIFNV